MHTLWQDLRYAGRMLAKSPGFTIAAVFALALGIGANTAIFSVVNGVLLRPLPYYQPDRLLEVWCTSLPQGINRMGFATPDLREVRDHNEVFEQIAAYYFRNYNLVGTGEPERVRGLIVSANLLQLLGVEPLLGRDFLAEEETFGKHRIVILSHGLWQRRFGSDPAILNKNLTLDRETYTVAGVMPPHFQFPVPGIALWTPMAFDPSDVMDTRNNHFVNAVARLKPGVTLEQARANLETIARRLEREYKENTGIGMSTDSFHRQMVREARPALLLLVASVACVLLIACANVAGLLLAKASTREREMAIRAALGARRSRLVRQLLTESMLLALLGGGLGVLVAYWGVDGLLAVGRQSLPRTQEIVIDARILLFTLLLSLVTGLLFGLAPAGQASRFLPGGSLKESGRSSTTGRRGQRLRACLVAGELALSLMLLIGAGLLIKTFYALLQLNPGFQAENVLTLQITLPPAKYSEGSKAGMFFDQLLKDIRALPEVRAAGATTGLPLAGGGWGKFFSIEGRPPATSLRQVPSVQHRQVTPEYFSALGTPLRRGRTFTDHDNHDAARVVIINSALARRFWPDEDPIGKRIWLGPPQHLVAHMMGPTDEPIPRRTIVGVVDDVRHAGLMQEPSPEVFVPHLQADDGPSTSLWLAVRATGDPQNVTGAVRARVLALDKEQPIASVMTMEQRLANSLARPRSTMFLIGIFAAVALVLAAIGLYGMISYSVAQRTHEIGIRMALGAAQQDVLRLVLKQGMLLVGVGVGVGLAGALVLTRFLSSLLYGVTPTDAPTFVGVSVLLAVVAILASYIPARRATQVDPMVALRYE